ncbi:3-isopropylmalate dehydratase large subunit [Croceicoccus gelatinilyticus]|uniref:3-isopropylmalate dehydratase large subunit n=1 Tax=Croceicoccus gelatinilyticus TaxID=2835536 RepID=UPI001BCBDC63|nr:3-isopropylmalate dehydratase large subunit [Croceicoccus gelatinilyticus]MBS7669029.1 3-isopropylmalate dehydratase large subunit [Croceicoccus gelatinilyticus]
MGEQTPFESPGAATLYERLWTRHVVAGDPNGRALLYIDRHLLHEVSTPQSFELLRANDLSVRRPATNLAVPDHAVPTRNRALPLPPGLARDQVDLLRRNCGEFGIELLDLDDVRQGIVHVISPEQGFTLPGITLVCGDSHTATHGAFGALAFGIGASECGTVMAAQCLWQTRAKTMQVRFDGKLDDNVTTKDLILALIGQIGAAGATGYAIEFTGDAIASASMEARMSLCNMAIEAGSRTGLIAPDDTTFEYLAERPRAPKGKDWDAALAYWKTLKSDAGAHFDKTVVIDASEIAPHVSWGTSPDQVAPIDTALPSPAAGSRDAKAQDYMGLEPGKPLLGTQIDFAFIGSCTNGRIEDLRKAAGIVKGHKVAPHVQAIVVPGSGQVKALAEAEGLDRVFTEAGFEWHSAGCSLCVAMNGDTVPTGKRSASTSNRNFEGRQGPGARTHLASPATVAASAIAGHLADPRKTS